MGASPQRRVELSAPERLLDGRFRVDRYLVRHSLADGGLSAPLERLVFERGDAVAVLPYDAARDEVVLVRQFRLPAHLRGCDGWLWEALAGTVEAGQAPEEVARREALEEVGYRLDVLEHVATCFPSPGGCTERVYLYLAPCDRAQRVARGGGLADEGEHIGVHVLPLAQALRMVEEGEIVDAKTMLLLWHLALRRRPRE